ncbi:MAG: Holliday junction DNA helicase RuvB C-terminal domain-containing protein [Fibrobacteraceae bacterium]|nr:Holliday junction DNA helicase RuvB C-terminal domain-containing protein [Fibrobacteraceae bacterium]
MFCKGSEIIKSFELFKTSAEKTLEMLGIDADGLDPMDRKILSIMIDKFNGRPVGINTLGAALNEEQNTLEEVYEPYLIQKGFLSRTPRGRMVTPAAYRKLERPFPKNQQYEQTEMEF